MPHLPKPLTLVLAAALIPLPVAFLSAQSGRSYAAGPVWWSPGWGGILPLEETYDNPEGQVSILNTGGAIQTKDHPFFAPLGTNGRACVTCHQPASAMSVSVSTLRERWTETGGADPVFAAIDGSNCPDLPQEDPASHSLLLKRGLFRISVAWPPPVKPDFVIEVVRDPTGCNTGARPTLSVYRRPRSVANLRNTVALMADGREPSLEAQATTAALVHEQSAAAPTREQLRQIVAFESQIFAAQSADNRGGLLTGADSPRALGPHSLGTGAGVALAGGNAMLSFDAWRKPDNAGDLGLQREFRASAARGRDLFFNGAFTTPNAARSTCASCHAADSRRWMDVGTTNRPWAKESADLPLFKITCDADGRTILTQDPGRALITGRCADVGAIVMQQFRGLAARAPYFSNGSAQTLGEVVDFYNRRFAIGYTSQQKQDLVNFLNVL